MEPSKFVLRERTSLPLILFGVYVYLCSNSLRRASRILEPFVERSHEAVRQWVQRLAPVCDRFDIDRREVHQIFVDETMVKIRGRQAWVWVAYEPSLKSFLHFRVSFNQSGLDAYLFLKEVRSRYGRKPVWTDEGRWYPEACRRARPEHHVYPVGWKNLIERFNQALRTGWRTSTTSSHASGRSATMNMSAIGSASTGSSTTSSGRGTASPSI